MTERPTPDLKILETRVYRGPNIWSYDKAIHLVVDLGGLEQFPTDKIPGFTEHLLTALPGIAQHSCSRGRRGGFVERLHEGTWLGHVTEHCALGLQQVVGIGIDQATLFRLGRLNHRLHMRAKAFQALLWNAVGPGDDDRHARASSQGSESERSCS